MALPRQYTGYAAGLTAPASHFANVTPDDNNDLDFVSRAIYVGSGGDIKVTSLGNETGVIPNLPSQSMFPLRVKRIHSTDTTATQIVIIA